MFVILGVVLAVVLFLREEYKERNEMRKRVEALRQEVEEFLKKK